MNETDEVLRDLEQRRQRNEERKRREIEIETAVHKLNVDWSKFQLEVAQLDGGTCHHDLRACRHILKQMGLPDSEIAIVLSYLPLQGGLCDCTVFFNVDMTKPKALVSFDCVDCGRDFEENYIVNDGVWAAAGLEPEGGRLCIGCLERRLGRRLTRDDFEADNPANEVGHWQSLRLRDRLTTR